LGTFALLGIPTVLATKAFAPNPGEDVDIPDINIDAGIGWTVATILAMTVIAMFSGNRR